MPIISMNGSVTRSRSIEHLRNHARHADGQEVLTLISDDDERDIIALADAIALLDDDDAMTYIGRRHMHDVRHMVIIIAPADNFTRWYWFPDITFP